MKRAIATLGIVAALITGSLLSTASPAYAADQEDNENITLTPAVSRPSLDAGQRLDSKMTVINNGASEYTFVVYARPYSVTDEQYDPNFTEVNEKTQAYQWVEFSQTEYQLAAGQRVDVPYTITVPENAAGGGHYAVLFAETQPPAGSDGSSVMRKKRVGSLLYMTVSGQVNQAGSVESWDTRTWQTKRPVTSTVRLKNTGNTHFQANVQVQYNNLLGKKRFEFNKDLLILPGTTRRIPIEWADAPIFGIYKASGTVHYLDKNDILPAHYIILLPANILLVALVIIVFTVLLVFLKKRSNKATPVS